MIALALALAGAAPAAAPETPRAFVERVYAQYRKPPFGSLGHPARWFAPRLLAAIEEDSQLAHGEVGYLDGDPLCGCQDYERISVRLTSYRQLTPARASIRVHVDLGFGPQDARDLRLSLIRTSAGWRIADVSSPEEPSLLAALTESNREQRKK